MRQVNVHEAKTQLSRLIDAAVRGEEVVIAKNNKPTVRLQVLPEAGAQRQIGGANGLLISMSEDFDAPLDDFAEHMQ